jgi:UDP-N-acetylglucosamine--N-acetylmuramyl-(pentapeptide) pyrophosphoryl-undecaprenol N-acetylglucosamine transferase
LLNNAFILSAILASILAAGLLILKSRWRGLSTRECRVMLSGGGTGGHVNPALAIAESIRRREPGAKFCYLGVRGKAEAVIVRRAGYPLHFVSSTGFPGLRPSLGTLRFLVRLSAGVAQSAVLLLWFCPRWVVATGGYVSAPVIIAVLVLRAMRIAHTRVFLHEQNSIPGQMNGLLGRWVDRVLLTFPQTLSFFPRNGSVVGYPIRHSIVEKSREEALANLSFAIPQGRWVVFAFGGSQGARTVNRAVVDALPHLLPYRDRLFIVHGTGLAQSDRYDPAADTEARLRTVLDSDQQALLEGFYYRQDYFHNIADVYAASDLIVCRSGAGSLNEISSLGKPALLIPKANLPGDHQVMNARAMKHGGAAEVIFEDTVVEDGQVLEALQGEVLADRILRLMKDPGRLEEMRSRSRQFLRRRASDRILSELFQDNSYNNGIGAQGLPFRPLLTNHGLLQALSAAYARDPSGYNPLSVVHDEDDLVYYRHRAAGLLTHEAWQDRNMGVKLIGYTWYHEKTPALLHMLVDRTPAHWARRLFGGDFRQVGFIRRNIVQALQVMKRHDAEIEEHLLIAAEDPYFEVRSQVCRALAFYGSSLHQPEVVFQAVLRALGDDCFEVAVEAARAIGEVGMDHRSLETLLRLRENHYWQVRDAGLRGIHRLLQRGIVPPTDGLTSEIGSFILTATDFRPHFSIKESYKVVQGSCRDRLKEGRPLREEAPRTADAAAARKP